MRLTPLPTFFVQCGYRCVIVGVLTMMVSATGWSATQGQWGRTSSATVKITLRIPERSSNNQHFVTPKNGFAALAHFCRHQTGDSSLTGNSNLYRFTVIGPDETSLNDLLAGHCRGDNWTRNIVSDQSTTATILVAPL